MIEESRRKIIMTADGSHTFSAPGSGLLYHSRHGAIQESNHVFIKAGFTALINSNPAKSFHILEMGFGTGLNAFLTLLEAARTNTSIHYTTLEKHPLTVAESASLNYPAILGSAELFAALHEAGWNVLTAITSGYSLEKLNVDLQQFQPEHAFHLIYFDAFAPDDQPELWTESVFRKLYQWLLPGGIFVTYSTKGSVRRALQAAGCSTERLPGPPGKREMLRARKAG